MVALANKFNSSIVFVEQKKTTHLLLLLNFVAIIFYFFVAINFSYLQNVEKLMYWSNDAGKYKEVAGWIFQKNDLSPYVALVPFFYPFFLGLTSFGGEYLSWFGQFILWVLAVNFTSLAVLHVTSRKLLMLNTFVIASFNISLIALTFHALTEILVLFLLSLWILLFVKKDLRFCSSPKLLCLTLILSLLVVTKPVYQFQLLLFFVVIIPLCLFWQMDVLRLSVTLLIALLPVFIQLTLMISLYDTFGLSKLGSRTIKDYYFSKLYMQVEELPDIQLARQQVQEYTGKQIVEYISQRPWMALYVYFGTIVRNMVSGSNFVNRVNHFNLYVYTVLTNVIYLLCHMAFFVVIVYLLINQKFVGVWSMALPYLFFLLIVFGSGFSFFQGDRLTISTLPLWLVVYATVQHKIAGEL